MRIYLLGFVFMLTTATSTPAAAQDWRVFATADGGVFSYDRSRLGNTGPRDVRVWARLEHTQDQPFGHRSLQSLLRVDCIGTRVTFLRNIHYSSNGSVLRDRTLPTHEQTVVPITQGSVLHGLFSKVCTSEGDEEAVAIGQ
jgi:hypothetical protein